MIMVGGPVANLVSCVRPKQPKSASFANIAHLHYRGQRSDGERDNDRLKPGPFCPLMMLIATS
jgi:hypothetical protein